MRLLRDKIDLVDRLDAMKGRLDEKLDYLFGLIDRDGSGSVDAGELATILRLRNADLSKDDAERRAAAMVAAFDADGNAEMDRDEFETFIRTMLVQLRLDPDEFVDFLSWNIVFPASLDNSCKGAAKSHQPPATPSSQPTSPSTPTANQPRGRGRPSLTAAAAAASPAEASEVRQHRRRSLHATTAMAGGGSAMTVPVRARGVSRSRARTAAEPQAYG
jgi:hypothetical protein